MNIAKIAVKRPVTTVMMVLIIIAFGILSAKNIKLDMMPNMDIPIAMVSTSYEGAGPEEIEQLITAPLEASLGTVPGIKNIMSTSSYGNSTIVVEFENGTDIDNAALDMRERIDLNKAFLPEGANDPIVLKLDINSFANITIGVTNPGGDLVELKRLVDEKVVNRLERQEGVASVLVSGGMEKEIEVTLHEEKMRGYGVTEQQVTQALRAENSNTPTGSVKQGDQVLTLRVTGEFSNLEEIRNLPITTPTGQVIYLRDIADVEEVFKESTSTAYVDGEPAVMLTVRKQSTANTVQVSNAVLDEMEQIQADMPELQFSMLFDPAEYIRLSLRTVATSALQGGLLAVLILFIFLRNVRSTLILAVAIPVSIVSTFVLMYYTDITLNILSLGGLALGVGMLVDNSVVVMESIYRKIEEGIEPKIAAVDGAHEVAASVTASTITTIAVFLPITFTAGLAAQIFNQLAMTITFSLLSSLLISLTFVPMACSVLLRRENIEHKDQKRNPIGKILDLFGKGIDALERVYEKALRFCLQHRRLTFLITLIFIFATLYTFTFVGKAFMPASDEGMITVNIDMPKGTLLEETQAKAFEVVEIIGNEPEIESIAMDVGGTSTSTDQVDMIIFLKEKAERMRSSDEVAIAMEDMLQDVAGCEISVKASSASMGSYAGAGIEMHIKGDDTEVLVDIANEVAAMIETIPGTREVSTSVEDTTPQATIKVDRVKASAYGVSAANIANTIQTAVSGTVATTFKVDGDEFDIRVRQDGDNFEYITDIENILIPTATGGSIPLYELAEVSIEETPASIARENQQKYVSVSTLTDGKDVGTVSDSIEAMMETYPMPDNYTWEFTGSMEQMAEAFGELALALLIAIALLYMIMAAEFESLVFPFIVMFSIPIALTGGLFGLFVTGEDFTITAFLGLIMLAGIVVNNAIVLIDYTNLLIHEKQLTPLEALVKAGPVRLRPILMTTLTTVLALIPMLLSNNEGSEMMKGLAAVVTFGLSLSTLVTLLFVPCVYLTMSNRREKKLQKKEAKRLKKLSKEQPTV